ncbi:MAG: serine/threonine-protein kinase [Gemmataceae bacterium]
MEIGAIEVLAALGQGAKSNVMLVRREADGQRYALKVTNVAKRSDRKYLGQSRQEFRVLTRLDHPNIVRAYALETETDWLLRPVRVKVLLEYVPGQTLDRLVAPGLGSLLSAFEQAADAVAYLHESGYLHADLKPNNIMLADEVAKVIDFGLAREIGEVTDRLQGTPEYMAPETASRKLVDVRTDIFNFAATMYRMFTGQHPPLSAVGFPMTERAYRDRYRPAAELNETLPPLLAALVDRCLLFDPAARPASMNEVCLELNRIVDEAAGGI